MTLSICIATYNRNKLLEKLLTSLVGQELPGNCTMEIIIVDNNPQAAAREVVNNFSSSSKIQFLYFVQKEKNISLTRNVAVKNATGDYVLFIDDDEYACDKWVMHLYNTLIKYDADGVFGIVKSYFDIGTPEWITSCYVFNRPIYPTGTEAKDMRTGNCMIKTSLLRTVEGPFEPAYGIIGGSDTKLFGLLRLKGAKFINSSEAETFEFVPSERANLKWVIRRSFRTANVYVKRKIELTDNNKIFIRIKLFTTGLLFSLISILLLIFFLPSKTKRVHWYLKTIANFAKVLAIFGYHWPEYS